MEHSSFTYTPPPQTIPLLTPPPIFIPFEGQFLPLLSF